RARRSTGCASAPRSSARPADERRRPSPAGRPARAPGRALRRRLQPVRGRRALRHRARSRGAPALRAAPVAARARAARAPRLRPRRARRRRAGRRRRRPRPQHGGAAPGAVAARPLAVARAAAAARAAPASRRRLWMDRAQPLPLVRAPRRVPRADARAARALPLSAGFPLVSACPGVPRAHTMAASRGGSVMRRLAACLVLLAALPTPARAAAPFFTGVGQLPGRISSNAGDVSNTGVVWGVATDVWGTAQSFLWSPAGGLTAYPNGRIFAISADASVLLISGPGGFHLDVGGVL